LEGDPNQPPPPERSRNINWKHFYSDNILSMPDSWEYPWFASWDLCFHSIVFARIDADFAKNQLITLAREWFMSPAGAIPAYEWAFDDVNPPLHAWAALQIAKAELDNGGALDTEFLADIFRYCLMYFTWWTNRKDTDQNDLFQGGFLGLDNISIIDRSHLAQLENTLNLGLELFQSDGTSWMGLFSLNMMEISLLLSANGQPEYGCLANKFFQNYVFIADALNSIEHVSGQKVKLWDDTDGFYYDVLKVYGGNQPDEYLSIKLRSLVGLMTLVPVKCFDLSKLDENTASIINDKFNWFVAKHPELLNQASTLDSTDTNKILLSFVDPDRLKVILRRMLDENEFLGPYGIRSLSRAYADTPYSLNVGGEWLTESYEPAESAEGLFGGNSNWRGPVWFPINFLLIESLKEYYAFLGDGFTLEYPAGSGKKFTLKEITDDISARLIKTFERNAQGMRPVFGGAKKFQEDPAWRDGILYYEYFHGDNGAGIGASHQTGWTGLVAELLHKLN